MSVVISVLRTIVSVFCSLLQLIPPYGYMLTHGGTKMVLDDWSKTDVYTEDYAVTIEKDPDKDFVILNFTDIQLSDDTIFSEKGEYTEQLLRDLINEVKPDLITLTGDNSSCDVGYVRLIMLLDSFKIPWAPVMGNHDGDNGSKLKEAWDSYKLMFDSEYCVFKAGPDGMGYGNYIVNITENGDVIHTLYMLDTHSSADDTEAGKINYGENGSAGYDHLWANQIEWYEWCVKGVENTAGHTVESTAFMHIPVYEYRTIQNTMVKDKHLLPEYADLGFGQLGEGVCAPEGNNGFFEKAKELGSTKMMVFGHDHTNNLCVEYEGIWLNYAQKSGHGSYWDDAAMGGSIITVGSDGHAVMSHVDYPAD